MVTALQMKVPLLRFKIQGTSINSPICFSPVMKGFLKFMVTFYRHKSFSKSANSSKVVSNQIEENLHPSLFLDDLSSTDLATVVERFKLKGLKLDYFYQNGVNVTADLNYLLFPFDSIDRKFSAVQSVTYKKEIKDVSISYKYSRTYLFGWSSVNVQEKEIVIVSDPLDVIAVNQETGKQAVSLSCDVSHFYLELLTPFKSFQKVTLWLKAEQLSPEVLHLVAQSFGKRVFLIRPQEYSCALSCFQSGLQIKHVLENADCIYHGGVDMLSPYRMILLDRFKNREKYSGRKWKRFSALNDILKGHRKGELTVFSGQTGTGKTTFVSEYSLDLCVQGLPTLWASFEVSNERLLETMFCQYAQCSFIENIEEFHQWFDKFEKLPMYILNIDGRQSLKEIFQALRLYVRVYNVQHVVVDNLQFLMNIENYNSVIDQYRKQDEIFGAFRGFATQCDCHVTLVIHPRKEPEFAELNNASISGTAKATQEADNILILQNTKTHHYLQITKNRFSGTKGCVMVEFDKSNYTFRQSKINITSDGASGNKVL